MNAAVELPLGSEGFVAIEVSGGVVSARELSTVQPKAVAVDCALPAASIARTSNS